MTTAERELATLQAPTSFRGYKWLAQGAVDPDHAPGWSWSEETSDRGGPPVVFATFVDGLPYRVDDELWEVELTELLGRSPFPEQTSYGSSESIGERELRILASHGRLVRRVEAWTADVAREFAASCAAATRERALDALRDADRTLSVGGVDELDVLGPLLFGADPEAVGRELLLLEHVEAQVAIWREALSADAFGISHPADAYAAAAASARAAAASVYATVDPRTPDDLLAPERGFLQERRRQAAWLRERLDLASPVDASPELGAYTGV
jgi:hypothetical protein